MSPLKRTYRDIQIVITKNFVVVSSVGIRGLTLYSIRFSYCKELVQSQVSQSLLRFIRCKELVQSQISQLLHRFVCCKELVPSQVSQLLHRFVCCKELVHSQVSQ